MLLRALDDFHSETVGGRLDRLWIRPRPLLLTVATSRLFLRRIAGLMTSAGVAGWSLSRLDTPWRAGAILVLFSAGLGALLIFAGLTTAYAATCFWTTSRNLVADVLPGATLLLGMAPMEHLNDVARTMLTWVIPVWTCVQQPVRLARSGTIGQIGQAFVASALSGLTFLSACVAAFYAMRRYYQSPGSSGTGR